MPVRSQEAEFKMHSIEADIPLVVSVEALLSLKAVVDFSNGRAASQALGPEVLELSRGF